MNDHQIMIFGRMLACHARVLGMQAENMQRTVLMTVSSPQRSHGTTAIIGPRQ